MADQTMSDAPDTLSTTTTTSSVLEMSVFQEQQLARTHQMEMAIGTMMQEFMNIKTELQDSKAEALDFKLELQVTNAELQDMTAKWQHTTAKLQATEKEVCDNKRELRATKDKYERRIDGLAGDLATFCLQDSHKMLKMDKIYDLKQILETRDNEARSFRKSHNADQKLIKAMQAQNLRLSAQTQKLFNEDAKSRISTANDIADLKAKTAKLEFADETSTDGGNTGITVAPRFLEEHEAMKVILMSHQEQSRIESAEREYLRATMEGQKELIAALMDCKISSAEAT